MVDGALDGCIEEAFDGAVEAVHGNQRAERFLRNGHGCHLEGIEHGTLAVGQVRPGGTDLADFLEDLLHQLEVVRRKGVVADEAFRTIEVLQGRAGAVEGDLVAQDVAFLFPEGAQLGFSFRCFTQQTLLDDFISVGAGQ